MVMAFRWLWVVVRLGNNVTVSLNTLRRGRARVEDQGGGQATGPGHAAHEAPHCSGPVARTRGGRRVVAGLSPNRTCMVLYMEGGLAHRLDRSRHRVGQAGNPVANGPSRLRPWEQQASAPSRAAASAA